MGLVEGCYEKRALRIDQYNLKQMRKTLQDMLKTISRTDHAARTRIEGELQATENRIKELQLQL